MQDIRRQSDFPVRTASGALRPTDKREAPEVRQEVRQEVREVQEEQASMHATAFIPATFTEFQASAILALEVITARDRSNSVRLLRAWTPTLFTHAQTECIKQLLTLDTPDFCATLADAMEPCDLRTRLQIKSLMVK